MKKLRKLTLMIAIGVTIFSCSSTKYRIIHKELFIPKQCIFEKFTDTEKATITESVGRRIFRNQENCRIRQERINSNIKTHNEAHSDDDR